MDVVSEFHEGSYDKRQVSDKTRVAKFFDFIKIPGKTLEQKQGPLLKKGKKDTNWALTNILKFVYFQRERVDKKEISGATVNYTKSICNVEMSQLDSYSQVGVLFHRNKMNY